MDYFLTKKLSVRRDTNSERVLKDASHLVDFSSNDYLGLSAIENFSKDNESLYFGSGGSRLLSGNLKVVENIEQDIADSLNAESALLFNSGYDANLGLFSAIPGRADTVIYDELIHASVRDGIRLGLAKSYSFRHNDLNHLRMLLEKASGQVFVAVESIYSMDGDEAPLQEILELCETGGAALIVDEAHAVGTIGKGNGLAVEYGIAQRCFARLVTAGKALGSHGGIILGSNLLRKCLINYARSFIYTTALPAAASAKALWAIKAIESKKHISELFSNVKLFKELSAPLGFISANAAIHCKIIPGNTQVKRVSKVLEKSGYDVRPILSPTVPVGYERLRICVHSFNTEYEIRDVIKVLQSEL